MPLTALFTPVVAFAGKESFYPKPADIACRDITCISKQNEFLFECAVLVGKGKVLYSAFGINNQRFAMLILIETDKTKSQTRWSQISYVHC